MSEKLTGTANCERDPPQGGKLYLYANALLTTRIIIHITEVGQNTKQNLEAALIDRIANKCVEEGFIRPKSIRIQSFTAGIVRSENVEFHVVYQCQVARPVEGQVLEATVKTITKAGIHAQCIDMDDNIPVTVFIARDHHPNSQEFSHVKEGDQIYACVIGTRFELNDPYIVAIASLVNNGRGDRDQRDNLRRKAPSDKPRITVLNEPVSDEEPEYVEEELDLNDLFNMDKAQQNIYEIENKIKEILND